jgi:tRNA (adenine57-N1/adenine58-N1)-methyltransferase catalytic subunit
VSEYATVYHRDACTEGFQMNDKADAVFLDLPQSWKALESAKVAIKRESGRICGFSSCIEQVQRTCLKYFN